MKLCVKREQWLLSAWTSEEVMIREHPKDGNEDGEGSGGQGV